MAITTLDGLIAAPKQRLVLSHLTTRTAVAAYPISQFDQAGAVGAGVLAGTSTTTGVVPTDATAGCPIINAFGGSAKGYVSRVEGNNIVSGRLILFDMLWKAGAYAFNASTTGQTPTSFSSRVPGGTDYTGTELWLEQVTAGTLVQNVAVTYNDQGGASSTTGTYAMPLAMILGRMQQIPLAAGDSGVQGVTGVVGSVASAGTFNILVLRRLAEIRIRVANDAVIQDALATGMPEVFADSALIIVFVPDSTASQTPEMVVDIANG